MIFSSFFSAITIGQTTLDDLATALPHHIYPVFDLYGRVEKITILNGDLRNGSPINEEVLMSNNELGELFNW